eukprot:TRINITY_DN3387_c1_g4_i2.p1 TRINITY_DN3387_c1_g4~~TRINITY_DN3387_c1_g4_i2.p1  ORF type:complete len:898 (+),score=305.99 TRINITY_DN3387_c1_g4_i2:76-2694(+)
MAVIVYEFEKWKPVRGWKFKGARVSGAPAYLTSKDEAQPPAAGAWTSEWVARGELEFAVSEKGPWEPERDALRMHWRRRRFVRTYASASAAPAPPSRELEGAAALEVATVTQAHPPAMAAPPAFEPLPATPPTPPLVAAVPREDEAADGEAAEAEPLAAELVVYENQRWRPVQGWKAEHLNFTDPTAWSDVRGDGGVEKEALEVPLAGGRWTSNWVCTDPHEAWQYSLNFNGTFQPAQRRRDFARRRTWVRRYAAAPGGGLPPPPPLAKLRACMLCAHEFGLARRPHDCKRCWLRVCSRCSVNNASIPGYATEQRVCNDCSDVLGKKVRDWTPGRYLGQRIRERRGKNKSRLLTKYVETSPKGGNAPGAVRCLRPCLKDAAPAGKLHVWVRGLRGVPAGWGGAAGTPNAQVDIYLSEHLASTPVKMGTHNPQWGAAEGTVALPVHHVTDSVYLCAYDISPVGLHARMPVGRAAVPLPFLKAGEPAEFTVQLLPCGDAEEDGYAKAPPARFRGVSDVSAKFGLPKPRRALGTISVTLTLSHEPALVGGAQLADIPLLADVPPAYFVTPTGALSGGDGEGDGDGDGEEKRDPEAGSVEDIDALKDAVARAVQQLGKPRLLELVWGQVPLAGGLVPFLYILAFHVPVFFWPLALAGCAIMNGYLTRDALKRAPAVVVFEAENSYKEESIFQKAHKIPTALRVVRKLVPLVEGAASHLAKASYLLAHEDPAVSQVGTAAVLAAAAAAGAAWAVLAVVPLRVYVFLALVGVVVAPAFLQAKKAAKASQGEAREKEQETGSKAAGEEGAPTPAVVQYAKNFYTHIPDAAEMAHRAICRQQAAAGDAAAATAKVKALGFMASRKRSASPSASSPATTPR